MSSTLGELNLNPPPDIRQRLATLDAWRQALDNSEQAYASEVQQTVSTILGAVPQFEETWRLICRAALDAQTDEMQALRPRFLQASEDRLRLLGEARARVQLAARAADREILELAQLNDEVAALEQKLQKVSTRWQTIEDLEDLAAESIAPSSEKLEAVRRQYGYPQAWYEDDSKPC